MADARKATFDLVELIAGVGSILGRHPLSSAVLLMEGTFLVAGLGVLPETVSTVLGFPTYPAHILLMVIGGGAWWRGLLIALTIAGLLEFAVAKLTGSQSAV